MADYGLLILRLVIGGGFIMHGYPKIAGGMEEVAGMLTRLEFPMPEISAWVLAITETLGGLFLVLGLMTRIAAIGPAIAMIVAIALVHYGEDPVGGQWISEGFERALLYLAGCLCLLMCGAGSTSVDHILFHGEHRDQRE